MERIPTSKAITVLRASGPWVGLELADLWRFRDLLLILAGRDLRLRYRQTALGVLWVLLQPLLGAVVLAFVFGRVAGMATGGVPHLPLAFAGLLSWGLFSTIVTRSTTSLVNYPHLISKVYFPRQLLPLSTVLPALVDFAVGTAVLIAMLFAYGMPVRIGVSLALIWVVPVIALSTGLGLFAATLAASYRDVAHVTPVLVQFLMFASPVAYSTAAVPERYRGIFLANPLAPLLEGFRASVLGTPAAGGRSVVAACIVSAATLFLGLVYFAQRQRKLADVI